MTALAAGEVIGLAEWRGAKIDKVSLRDTKTGATRNAVCVRHGLELDSKQLAVTEWLPDGTEKDSIKIPWAKGQRLVLKFDSLATNNGSLQGKARMEAFEK
jgi:hypothetical protein